MDWDLNADQRMIRDTVREFVAAEIAPHAADWDREKIFPADVFRQLGEMGLFGMTIAEERGGAGLDLITYCLVLEELARGDASTCVAISVTNSVYCAPLQRYGNAEQQQRFLAPCAQGDWLGAFCLSEPDAGSDAGGLKVRADRLGGDFVINGTKAWVTNGGVCGAMLVFAVTGHDFARAVRLAPDQRPRGSVRPSGRGAGARGGEDGNPFLAYQPGGIRRLPGARGLDARRCRPGAGNRPQQP